MAKKGLGPKRPGSNVAQRAKKARPKGPMAKRTGAKKAKVQCRPEGQRRPKPKGGNGQKDRGRTGQGPMWPKRAKKAKAQKGNGQMDRGQKGQGPMWLGYFTLGKGLAPPANGIPQARTDRGVTPRAQALTPAVRRNCLPGELRCRRRSSDAFISSAAGATQVPGGRRSLCSYAVHFRLYTSDQSVEKQFKQTRRRHGGVAQTSPCIAMNAAFSRFVVRRCRGQACAAIPQ